MSSNPIKSLFSEINLKHIDYCVLRNYESLPESTGGSDLDILIHTNSIRNFYAVFNEFLIKNELSIVSILKDKHFTKFCLVKTDWAIQIDVFEGGIYYGEKQIIESDFIFKKVIEYKNIKVLEPKVAALLAFLKEVLNNKTCHSKYITSLQYQFESNPIENAALSGFDISFVEFLNNNISSLNETLCLKLKKLSKKHFKKSRLQLKKLTRLFRQPGFTIAFLGTDGSGKSTIINAIRPVLDEAFHKAVYYEHLRPNRLPSLAKLLGKKEDFNGTVSNPHKESTSGLVGSLFRWVYYLIDYTIGFYLKVFPKKVIRSCVWLFDRYYYDYLIDPKRTRVSLPKWLLKIGQRLIPEPDMIICLGTDAQKIHQRKPELPLAEIERQVSALKLFSSKNKRAFWIDTGSSIDDSSKQVLQFIIEQMSNRFKNTKWH